MTTTGTRRWLIAAAAVVVIAFAVVFFQPTVKEALAPQPVAAWVAIEVDGSGEAFVGRVEIVAGTPFRLHSVLEARDRAGDSVYYTEAPGLRMNGEAVASDKLLSWAYASEVKNLWFTVEGGSPFIELPSGETTDALRFQEFFHPEWSTDWTVNGVLDSRFGELADEAAPDRLPFGTQHYQVWVEIFAADNPLVPRERFKSPGADVVLDAEQFPAVRAVLPEAPLASGVMGLSQVELPDDASPEAVKTAAARARAGVLFSKLLLLRDLMSASGSELADLEWRRLDLQTHVPWSDGLGAGDLLQVGARWVVLYRDEGKPGVLDGADLCFDFERGAAVRRLEEVFEGGEGEIDWMPLGARRSG